ncbi:MAG: glycoside hydrolase family 57 protein [Candidatus Margulisiibacteriota bacterium]
MNNPIYLAIIWHMHQPYYKDLVTGEYILPWVRLHCAKDYYDMVAILDDYPNVKATFNLVPSLFSQIEDYVQNDAKDKSLLLSEKDPKDLTTEEIVYILKNFFMTNWEVMIKPYRRYHDLLLKRGRFSSISELTRVATRLSAQEIMDLQVWFNLSWFGFNYRKKDPVVKAMIEKGKNFSAEDKRAVLAKQKEIMSLTMPKYKELAARGQIELTTSPFYHPILPLICDTNAAKESMPHINLPSVRYQHPEDAKHQIESAVAFHEAHFGEKPAGMWPSEGSVSEQILPLLKDAGIKWIATDESVLASSLNVPRQLASNELYKPYAVGDQLNIIFRNHFLSDQVGFVYQRWRAKDSANDFIKHLHNIRASLPSDGRNYLVTVILDGENAWEYYKDGGEEFLREFYQRIASDHNIITTRPKDYMANNPSPDRINRLFAASWINNNFRIWIGHEEDNLAWDYLARVRAVIEGTDNALAWQELYIAEGSDWCWWYGDDHSSENDEAFDSLYRKHLKNIYQLLGKEAPKYLDKPIKSVKTFKPTREPVYLINPEIDGVVTNYYEWLSAGYFDVEKSKGAMHQIDTLLKAFYYGFSRTELFIRLDCQIDFINEEPKQFSFGLITYTPNEMKAEINNNEMVLCRMGREENWEEIKKMNSFAIKKIVEFSIPFSDLGINPGDELQFCIVIMKDGKELERWPRGGVISLKAPTTTYEMEQWSV